MSSSLTQRLATLKYKPMKPRQRPKHLTRRSSSNDIVRDPLTSIQLKHGSTTSAAAKHDIRIKICSALNQLNDTDARSIGVNIIHRIIDNLDVRVLPLLLECLFPISGDQKAMCRKEYALLLGYTASKRGNCTEFYSYLSKLSNNLARRAQDSDSRVRQSCAVSFSMVTKQVLRYHGTDKANEYLPKLLKPLLKQMDGNNNPHNLSGSLMCISAVIRGADQSIASQMNRLSSHLIKHAITVRKNRAHSDLLACVESLIMVASAWLGQHLSPLIAIMIDALTSKEWATREAAIKALHALGIVFSSVRDKPEIETNRTEIIAHLERLKFDKISNVRKVASTALSVWEHGLESKTLIEEAMATDSILKSDMKQINSALEAATNPIATDNANTVALDAITNAKPWFDQRSENESPIAKLDDKDESMVVISSEEKESDDTLPPINANDNSSNQSSGFMLQRQLLQQQQIMIRSLRNLEDYVRKEVCDLNSRVHCVERSFQSLEQKCSAVIENSRTAAAAVAASPAAVRVQLPQLHSDNEMSPSHHNNGKIEVMAQQSPSQSRIRLTQSNVATVNNSWPTSENLISCDSVSQCSDDTQILDINQHLLQIIRLDNNVELVRWLENNQHCCLLQCIDTRLMISLMYRITQMLKNKEYLRQIGELLDREFASAIQCDLILPMPLQQELFHALKQNHSISDNIDTIIQNLNQIE